MRAKLQPGETVALIVRKHWLVLVKPALFLVAVLLYVPVRHIKILGFETLLNYLLPYALAVCVALFLYRYLDRSVNIWAVTDRRLIDEWGILTHRSKENPLDKINDIVVEQTILGRIFGYGSMSVQTAATAGETIIEFVERPEELKQTINAQKAMSAESRAEPNFGDSGHQRNGASSPTVLLHESVRPPFSLRCPHCEGEITIDYTRGGPTDHGDGVTKTASDQMSRPEHSRCINRPPEAGPRLSATEEANSLAASPKVDHNPFGWKKHSR